jgi:L-amino acid N-acyltransferase YncA
MANRIRSVTTADAEAVRMIYAPYVSDSATSFEAVVPDLAEMTRRIEAQADRYPWLVFESGDRILGYAYASPHRARTAYQWSVEVSVYVHADAHRRGVGRALYIALFELLRRQGYINAYAGITLPNPSSVGLHESLGFVPVGVYRRIGFKFDRWHDVEWLHLRLVEDPRPMMDPLSVADVWRDGNAAALLEECTRTARLESVRQDHTG